MKKKTINAGINQKDTLYFGTYSSQKYTLCIGMEGVLIYLNNSYVRK